MLNIYLRVAIEICATYFILLNVNSLQSLNRLRNFMLKANISFQNMFKEFILAISQLVICINVMCLYKILN